MRLWYGFRPVHDAMRLNATPYCGEEHLPTKWSIESPLSLFPDAGVGKLHRFHPNALRPRVRLGDELRGQRILGRGALGFRRRARRKVVAVQEIQKICVWGLSHQKRVEGPAGHDLYGSGAVWCVSQQGRHRAELFCSHCPYVDQIHNSDIDLDPEYQRGEEQDLRRVHVIANTCFR